MKGLLLKYNKVHDHSLQNLSWRLSKKINLSWGDLGDFGKAKDLLLYDSVEKLISSFGNIDFVVAGDVFWETGQNLCRHCSDNGIKLFFLQHGQWIYTKNKKKLPHYPSHTLLFGKDVHKMCNEWDYGKHSKVIVTGSPRYDEASANGGSYVYFSPPAIEEMTHGVPSDKINNHYLQSLRRLRGIDREVSLVIQPHYRESRTDLLQKMFPSAQFADPDLDTLKLIRGSCKVLASRNSTVVLDAIAHQKPVVLMDFPETDRSFFERGHFNEFAYESSNTKEVLENLRREVTINRVGYADRASRYIYLGNASARISELIQREV